MSTLQLCALAVTGVSAAMILKQWSSGLLPLLRLALLLLIAFSAIGAASPIVTFLKNMSADTLPNTYVTILFKALGLALLTQYCAELCRECGEGGIASGVETFGKIQILLLSLPLLSELFLLAQTLLEQGGAS